MQVIKVVLAIAMLACTAVAKECALWCTESQSTWTQKCAWTECSECSECGECVSWHCTRKQNYLALKFFWSNHKTIAYKKKKSSKPNKTVKTKKEKKKKK